ncbi:MAG: ECF-type sigma factor [Acidobacteriota bacterium]
MSQVLRQAGQNSAAIDQILPRVYRELYTIAQLSLRKERREHTLSATALVHEAYLRLSGSRPTSFRDRQHFFAAAATVMRRVLVDHARHHQAQKRIPREQTVAFDESLHLAETLDLDLLALDQALCALGALDPRLVKTVELRFFAGLSEQQTADVLEVSPTTVRRAWATAKVWLRREMQR